MRLRQKFLALPSSLLLFLIPSSIPADARDDGLPPAQWLYNRPSSSHRRRNLGVVQEHILAGHTPVAVRKMSEDESEKFFPEYWGFREQGDQFPMVGAGSGNNGMSNPLRKEYEEEEALLSSNASVQLSFRPAFMIHAKQSNSLSARDTESIIAARMKSGRSAAAVLELLGERDFVCPDDTSACSNASYLCCATGEVCISIPNTPIGSIGCCPSGVTCVGNITCAAGNTPCSSSIGGGCCIPGYVCAGIGCVPSIVTVVTTLIQSVPTSSPPLVVTTTSTPAASTTIVTSVTITTTSTSIPINTATLTPTAATASAPLRGTSASIATQVTISTSTAESSCPTGYYPCLAYYNGGCCRTGRDCATTDCPSAVSATLVSSGITIVVPLTGAATTTASGTCATGWSLCAPAQGGSCCPSGWSCGMESCTSVAGTTSAVTEAKEGVLLSKGVRLGAIPLELLEMICLITSLLLVA